MQQYHHIENIKTTKPVSIIRLDDDINSAIQHCGFTEGFVIVSSRHIATAITINQHDASLLEDITSLLTKIAPSADRQVDSNYHLMAMLLGSSEAIPIANRKMQLSENQSVMLVELDGPSERTVNIQVIGDVKQTWQ